MSLTETVQESSYLAYIVSVDHNPFGRAEIMSIFTHIVAIIQL